VLFKDNLKGNKPYFLVAIIVVIIIILAVLFSGNQIFQAYIDDKYLENYWIEDINERYYKEDILGLEKQSSFTYRIKDFYNEIHPTFLTITSVKTFFLINENDLSKIGIETINTYAIKQNISINKSSQIRGKRIINNGHKTDFIIYEGFYTDKNIDDLTEKIYLISETWNCCNSGTSIICFGFAQVTDNLHNNSEENLTLWNQIISDENGTFVDYFENEIFNAECLQNKDGLIYNVRCH
jgi:hypothetical protein